MEPVPRSSALGGNYAEKGLVRLVGPPASQGVAKGSSIGQLNSSPAELLGRREALRNLNAPQKVQRTKFPGLCLLK